TPAHGPATIITETHVHADERPHALDGPSNDVQELFRPVRPTGETWLVQLKEGDAGVDQLAQFAVDERQQRLGDFAAVAVDLAAIEAASQCERPGHRHFDWGVRDRPQPLVLRDDAKSLRRSQRRNAAIAAALVMRRRSPAP